MTLYGPDASRYNDHLIQVHMPRQENVHTESYELSV